MEKEIAELLIVSEIFKREIESVDKILGDKSKLRNDLNYQNESINEFLKKSFSFFTDVLKKVIDENYQGYFEMPNFLPMNCQNFTETINNNLEILAAARRVQKFIN